MTTADGRVDVFETLRPHLLTVAYRLTGSFADAEDAVQDAWLRWDRTGEPVFTRGTKRVVVCLTSVDPGTGRLRRFAAVSRAAEWLGRVSDNVCQAIKRKGLCGGHRWDYEDELPRDFDELGAVAALGVRSPLASAA